MLTILYTFHGLGGSVRGDFDQVYDALSRLLGNQMPVVASLSLGSDGVMGDEAGEVERIAIPEIERRIGGDRSFRRVLLGGSMGGHNVMRLLASAERGRYAGAAAVCPALATFNGHRPEEVEAYKRRNAAVLDMEFFERALATYKVELPTESIWEANNPFTLLANGAYVGTPIFISVGTEDSVGFLEGSREFRDRAQRYPGVDIEYHEVGGKHCAFDFPRLMQFLFGKFRG